MTTINKKFGLVSTYTRGEKHFSKSTKMAIGQITSSLVTIKRTLSRQVKRALNIELEKQKIPVITILEIIMVIYPRSKKASKSRIETVLMRTGSQLRNKIYQSAQNQRKKKKRLKN